MATQTGSIDLRGANSAKLYVDDEAGEIRSEVSETYATKTEVRRTDTGSGTVVSSDDAANLPPLSLTIHGKSVQNGTPTPSAPVEIESVEPRNITTLFDHPLSDVYNATTNPDGYWASAPSAALTVLTDGWASFTSSGTVTAQKDYGFNVKPLFGFGTTVETVAVMVELRNVEWSGTAPRIYCPYSPATTVINGGNFDVGASAEQVVRKIYVTKTGGTYNELYRGIVRLYANSSASFDIRISIYRGAGVPAYIPSDSVCSVTNGRNLVTDEISGLFVNSSGGVHTSDNAQVVIAAVERNTDYTLSYDGGNRCVIAGTGKPYISVNESLDVIFSNTSAKVSPKTFNSGEHDFIACFVATSAAPASNIQVEKGTTATEYEAYAPSVTPIDLQGYEVCTGDTLNIDSEGNVTLVKKMMSVTYNGSNPSSFYYDSGLTRFTTPNGFTPAAAQADTSHELAMCNRLPLLQQGGTARNVDGFTIINNLLYISMSVSHPEITDVNALATWLQSNPLTVLYTLAEPQTISLGKIDLPSLPSPSFSLHVDAAVTPTIDAEWWTRGGEEVGSVYQRTSALEQDVDGLTLELSEKVDSSEEWVSWLHAGTDATTHEPYLAMGKNSAYPSVVYGSDAARFYDGEGDAAENVVASFGTEGVTVGKDGSANTTITDSDIVFHDADGNEAGKISMSSAGAVPASAAYTITTSGTATASDSITGITPLPDFTLGNLFVRVYVDGTGISTYVAESLSERQATISSSTIDVTIQPTQSGETWGIDVTATNKGGATAQTVVFALDWYYTGSAPQYKFGTGENAGAYSFLAGVGLKTAKPAQVALGSYNEPSQTDLFIVGDGTSDGNRSNALWIDENRMLHIVSFSQYAGGVELTQSALWSWQQALFGYSDSEDWTYLAGSASGNFCRWRIASGWMQVEIYYTSGAGLTANTAKHYGAIPGNFAPDHEVNNALYLGANKNGQADMCVTSGGAVWVNSTIASSTVYGQLQYPVQRPL